jgi:uncharacterized membrane protein
VGITELIFLSCVVLVALWMQVRLFTELAQSKAGRFSTLREGSVFAVGAILFLLAIQIIAIRSLLRLKSQPPSVSILIVVGVGVVLASVAYGVSQLLIKRRKKGPS